MTNSNPLNSFPIELEGESFQLLPQRAMYHAGEKVLFLADLHIGKVFHFRRKGIAVPENAAIENLNRLSSLLHLLNPLKVYFLGDLFHSGLIGEWKDLIGLMKSQKSTLFVLVRGNHESVIKDHEIIDSFDEIHADSLLWNKFLLSHEPDNQNEFFNICGHIHPAVRIHGKARQNIRLPCFFLTGKKMILPSFGSFTGSQCISPNSPVEEKAYAILEDSIVPVA